MSKQRSDAERNKQHILNTANQLFNERSVQQVSMKEIATYSGIGQGTLYRHFENKAAICRALMDQAITQMFLQIESIEASPQSDSEKIKAYLYAFVTLINGNKEKLEAMKDDGSTRKIMMDLHFYGALKQVIQARITQLNIVKDPEFHTDILLNSFSKDVFDYHCIDKQISPFVFADRIHFIFIERLLER